MIWVISNKREYSDHRLYFVEGSIDFDMEAYLDEVFKLSSNVEDSPKKMAIVAKCSGGEWEWSEADRTVITVEKFQTAAEYVMKVTCKENCIDLNRFYNNL
jgi:hypothetical protein